MAEPSTDQESAVTAEAINTMIAELFPGFGNVCVEVDERSALARIVPTQEHLRPGGFISGPTQFGAADAALWYLTFGAIGRLEPMALTSELSIRYLRPAVGDVLWARADLEVAGRRNVVGTVRIWTDTNDAKPSATAQGTYVLPH
ncbi:MAG: PaaI family thioesterase [Actinomycetota bacterium]